MRISDETYVQRTLQARLAVAEALKTPAIADLVKRVRDLSPTATDESKKWRIDHPMVKAAGRAIMKAQYEAYQKVNPP